MAVGAAMHPDIRFEIRRIVAGTVTGFSPYPFKANAKTRAMFFAPCGMTTICEFNSFAHAPLAVSGAQRDIPTRARMVVIDFPRPPRSAFLAK